MAITKKLVSASLFQDLATFSTVAHEDQYTDTDPQMLYALWQMEMGADPDQSLEEVKGAVVVYDKFRPRVSRRR